MKKIISLIVVAFLVFALCVVLASCGNGNTDTPKESNDDALKTEEPAENKDPEEKEGLYLKTLGFDDDFYSIGSFDPEVTEYNVALPKGNARLPKVIATAKDGITVVIAQPEMTKEDETGKATVTISDSEGNTKVYTLNLERDISGGFILCAGDEWQFELGYLQTQYREGYTYESSNPEFLSVDENGLMKALKETNEEITVVAKLNGKLTDTLVVDRIEKAE